MNDDELKKIWKSAPVEQVRLEKSSMMNAVQTDVDRWSEMLKSRNALNRIVVLMMIPVLALMAFTVPSGLAKAGAALYLVTFVFLVFRYRYLNLKQPKSRSLSESYLHYLYQVRDYLKSEVKLLNDTLHWQLPLFATASLLFFAGSFTTVLKLVVEIVFLIAAGFFAFFFYKRMHRKVHAPRLEKVEELIKAMEE